MRIPLNVLLYQFSPNADFDTQNVDLSHTYDRIELFSRGNTVKAEYKHLYLISEESLSVFAISPLKREEITDCVFLCISQRHTKRNAGLYALSIVFLYVDEPFEKVFNKVENIFREFDAWSNSFHLGILGQMDLQTLLDLTKPYLAHPMVVLDRSFSLLGYVRGDESTDPIMESILEEGYVTPATMNRLRQDGLISTSENADNPLINWYCITTNDCYYSMMYRFIANNHTVGYAIVFRCKLHPKTNYLYVMNTIYHNLNLYFQQERYRNWSTSEIYETVLAEIMENPHTSRRLYEDKLNYVQGMSLKGRFMLAKLSYQNKKDLPHSFVCWNLRNAIPKLKPFVSQGELYILAINTDEAQFDQFLSEEQKGIFNQNFRGFSYVCGVSQPFYDLMDLADAAKQCEEAVLLLSDSDKNYKNEEQQGHFYCYKDAYLLYIIKELKRLANEKMLVSPYYAILKEYDKDHNSDLCHIFAHYLQSGRSIAQTSSEIYLHRNTVLNKVKKATQVMNNEIEELPLQIGYLLSYLEDNKEV